MNRRQFLGTVAGGLAAAPLDAADNEAPEAFGTPKPERGLRVRTSLNFEGTVKGVNLTSKPGAPLEKAYWIEWDWSGWIRPQVDCAIALGANSIRIIGDVAMVMNRGLSQATYNTRLQQLLAYCAEKRIAFYYTGCALQDTNGSDNGNAAAYNANPRAFVDVIASNVRAVTAGSTDYSSWILGCDLVQEANAWGNGAAVNAIYSALRPIVPASIPCTFSMAVRMQDAQWISAIAGSCDFLDYHIYPQLYGGVDTPPAPAAITEVRAVYPDKEILFGEGGIDAGAYTSSEVEAWINAIINLGDAKGTRGAMLWAATDQDRPYGAFDSGWRPRAAIAGPWLRWCRLPYLPVPRVSADGATIPPAVAINTGAAVWTLGPSMTNGKQVLINNASAAGGQATVLSWRNGQIKAQNSAGAWWLWTGSAWAPTTPP